MSGLGGNSLRPNRFPGLILDARMLYNIGSPSAVPTGLVSGRSAVLNDSVTRKIVRRRRSWYRRRLRIQRTLVAVVVAAAIAGACWQNVARYFSLPTLHASQMLPDSF